MNRRAHFVGLAAVARGIIVVALLAILIVAVAIAVTAERPDGVIHVYPVEDQ